MEQIVIVGGGLAGHRAAEALRKAGFGGAVVLVGDETHRPYDRPPLSKQLLAGSMTADETLYRVSADANVTWTLGQAAVSLDRDRQVVRLADGTEVPYDGLMITTGRRARSWPELPELEGFHVLRSLDDAAGFREAVSSTSRVVIVGAGFIGCEVAATLRGLGVTEVAVVDIAPFPMPVLGAEVGKRAITLHEQNGVRFFLSTSVSGFAGQGGRVSGVDLADGRSLPADVVLLALGSAPNTEWLEGSGLELLDGAVLCDEHCVAVGTSNIVAAGDVAAWPHPQAGRPICIEHWAIARDMAATAATNLLADPGGRASFATVPTFWSDQYSVKMKSAGLLAVADRFEVVEEDTEKPSLVVEAFRGQELIGAIVFNKNKAIIGYQRALAGQLAGAR
ncbi:FAD/NAD(P)-binding oxidoreductase [Paraconexibacter sp. AEG42_29]|uniref:NAD(P)/FAD-dependent oxidoreductase n=1 Tax=Paraconexibacter sp. AEG42_29 TaxID=2997339 RepID=UPI00339DA38C